MCNSVLDEQLSSKGHKCTGCDYFITKLRFEEMVMDMHSKKHKRDFSNQNTENNLSELNNMEL